MRDRDLSVERGLAGEETEMFSQIWLLCKSLLTFITHTNAQIFTGGEGLLFISSASCGGVKFKMD